jgi:hypothetical protein
MTAPELLSQLEGVRQRGTGKHSARCPSHQDRSPSLSITETDTRILLHCFSGCETAQIVAALGLSIRDLFTDAPTPHGHRPTPRPVRTDYAALAFQFELAALDRRLRTERVREVISNLPVSELSDHDRARITTAIARAEADVARADLFEAVADDLRLKEFVPHEGMVRHAV